ncbi:hypothetical protein CR513_03265, partial [Mucuna pruriens]
MADALATLSTMVQVAHCQYMSREATKADLEPWYFDINRYLEKVEYLEGASENSKRTLRRLTSNFLLSGTECGYDTPLIHRSRRGQKDNRGTPRGDFQHTCKWTRLGP